MLKGLSLSTALERKERRKKQGRKGEGERKEDALEHYC
jgi:hypothetical protein